MSNSKYISGKLEDFKIPFNSINLYSLNDAICSIPKLKERAREYTYKLKTYGKYYYDTDTLVISIYYAKQTCIVVRIDNFTVNQDYYTILNTIVEEIGRQLSKGLSFFGKDDTIKICEGDDTMKKSKQEIEYEQFAANKEAELKVRTQEIQREIDEQIEQKRLEMQEDQKRQQQAEIAANYWYFYRGLIDAGFTEDQAMQILLNKMSTYVPPMTCVV